MIDSPFAQEKGDAGDGKKKAAEEAGKAEKKPEDKGEPKKEKAGKAKAAAAAAVRIGAGRPPAPKADGKKLAPELEKKLADSVEFFLKRNTEPRKKRERERMEELIEEIRDKTGLGEEAAKPLREAAEKAIAATSEAWLESTREYMRETWRKRTTLSEEMLDQWRERLTKMDEDTLIQGLSVPAPPGTRPEEQEAWKKGVEAALSDEQRETWANKIAAEEKEREDKFKALVERYRKRHEPQIRQQVDPAIKKMAEAIVFDEKRREALKKLTETAVEIAMKNIEAAYRKAVENMAESQQEMVLNGRMSISVSNSDDILESKQWKEGIAKLLTPEELQHWNRVWKDFRDQEEKRLAELADRIIKDRAQNMRNQQETQVNPIVGDIRDTIGLAPAAEKKLDDLMESALDAYEEAYKEAARKYLDGLSFTQREQMIRRGYVSVATSEEMLPLNQKVWKEGLEKLLSKDDLSLWETTQEQRQERRKESFGKLILLKIDTILGLSPEQREQILPILTKLGEERYLRSFRTRSFNVSSSTIYSLFRSSSDQKKVGRLLEDSQKKRWDLWINRKLNQYRTTPIKRDESRPEPASDEGYIEEAISRFLITTIGRKREEYVNYQLAKLDDLARVVNLEPEQEARLRIAAKGMCEVEIDALAAERADWVRSSVRNVNRDQIYNRLTQLSSSRFGKEKPEENGIWTETFDEILTDEQKKTWEETIAERKRFENEVIVQQLLTQAENALHLSSRQIGEIEPIFRELLGKHAPDIEKSFSTSEPWYFYSTYSLCLVEGIPDKRKKEILTKRQLELWDKQHKQRMSGYWTRIEGYYKQRAEEKSEE